MIANLPNSAQLEGTPPTIPQIITSGSVQQCKNVVRDRQTHTHTHTTVVNTHFAWPCTMPNSKGNDVAHAVNIVVTY